MFQKLELFLTKGKGYKWIEYYPTNYILNYKRILFLLITSFLIPIIGTLSHEIGHYLVTRILGFNAYIHYGFISFDKSIEENLSTKNNIFILLGGVLQTVTTSLLFFYFLLKKKKIIFNYFYFRFSLIYFSLFISREIINFIVALILGFINNQNYFGENSDEKKISILLGFWEGLLPLIMFCFSLLLIIYILANFIKKKELIIFLTITIISGSIGMYFWLVIIGPLLLP